MKYKTHIKLVHELYGTYMQYKQSEEIKINHLTPLLVVTMPYACGGHIILRTSSDVFIFNLGSHFEGLFKPEDVNM